MRNLSWCIEGKREFLNLHLVVLDCWEMVCATWSSRASLGINYHTQMETLDGFMINKLVMYIPGLWKNLTTGGVFGKLDKIGVGALSFRSWTDAVAGTVESLVAVGSPGPNLHKMLKCFL